MAYLLFSISAVGLVLLIIFISKLVTQYSGWNCKYNSSNVQAIASIPKSGRYSINIRRDRFWLWKGYGGISDAFPMVNFSVRCNDSGEEIPYYMHRSLMTGKGVDRITMLVGYFNAPISGDYLITSLPENRFIQNDEVVIRKHMSFIKLFLLIWGICLSALAFLAGLIFGILLLTGVV